MPLRGRVVSGDSAQCRSRRLLPREVAADLVIVGGGLGGCAAALAALENNLSVILTEPTDWIGGQLTAQAVPPDEHPWIEQFGRNARYQKLRQGIRDYYRRHYPLTAEARASAILEPRSRRRFAALPRAEGGSGRAHGDAGPACLQRAAACAAGARADRGRGRRATGFAPWWSATARPARAMLIAPYFLDATELGDLLPMAGVEFVIGAEGRDQTGEPHAAGPPSPTTSRRSPAASRWSTSTARTTPSTGLPSTTSGDDFVPTLEASLAGTAARPDLLRPDHAQGRSTAASTPAAQGAGLWVYRRILDPRNFQPGAYPGKQRDHAGQLAAERLLARSAASAPGSRPPEAERHIARAKQLSLSLLYWLQTECPRPDGKTGWKGLRLRPDLVGTEDGLAKAPYIRESRRIQAEFTVVEQHVGTEAARGETHQAGCRGRDVSDSVGVGSYRIDLHPSTGGDQLHRHQLAAVPDPAGCTDSRAGSRTCCPPARTWARPISPMAATGSIPSSGPSARRPGHSPPSAWNSSSVHPPCGIRPIKPRGLSSAIDAARRRALLAEGAAGEIMPAHVKQECIDACNNGGGSDSCCQMGRRSEQYGAARQRPGIPVRVDLSRSAERTIRCVQRANPLT